jgi:hypothetical protein
LLDDGETMEEKALENLLVLLLPDGDLGGFSLLGDAGAARRLRPAAAREDMVPEKSQESTCAPREMRSPAASAQGAAERGLWGL